MGSFPGCDEFGFRPRTESVAFYFDLHKMLDASGSMGSRAKSFRKLNQIDVLIKRNKFSNKLTQCVGRARSKSNDADSSSLEAVMDAIIAFSPAECDGLRHSRNTFPAWILSVTILIFLALSLPAEAGKPAGSSGGTPPGGGTQVLPSRLGLPNGCSSTEGYGLNDGAQATGRLVVVGQGLCSSATKPLRWQNGNWADVFSYPISGIANDASNESPNQPPGNATVVGWTAGANYFEFVQPPGSTPIPLPRLSGTTEVFGYKLRISDNGEHITGFINGLASGEIYGIRWSLHSGTWQAESLGLDFYPRAISDDGSVVVGNVGDQAMLWVESSGGGGEFVALGEGFAEDINPAATMVVGYRPAPCSGSCTWYPAPVYWVEADSGWARHDLNALDGVDSKAKAVADVGGKRIIVGWGYTRKDAIQRAVAWIPDAKGNYGQPLRLDAIDGRSKSWARAEDINRNGVVLGNSQATAWQHEAVLWILPK